MSHTENQEVTYYSGHVIEVNGKRYAKERTCRVIGHSLSCDECQCEEWALSCGHEVINESDGYPPSYCSECGAKVVGE